MRRAITHLIAGQWPEAERVATVTLDFDDRHRRRIRLSDDTGEDFLLDLPMAVRLGDGDGLSLDCGGIIHVRAADEAVLDIQCGDLVLTARIAWHIGNRHIPIQVLEGGNLRIRDDHVLAKMLQGLGAHVHRHRAPFSPEPGAYAEISATEEEGHGHHHHD